MCIQAGRQAGGELGSWAGDPRVSTAGDMEQARRQNGLDKPMPQVSEVRVRSE